VCALGGALLLAGAVNAQADAAGRPECGPEFQVCVPCPNDRPDCTYTCRLTGACRSRCERIEICSPGFRFNVSRCRCIPEVPQTAGNLSETPVCEEAS
jgi:hypothetical protein